VVVNLIRRIVWQLTGICKEMVHEQGRIREMHELVSNVMTQFHELVDFAKSYDGSIFHFKLHCYGIATALIVSLILPRVFVPTLSLTGLFVFIEWEFRNTSVLFLL
jgi:hypothetical protein